MGDAADDVYDAAFRETSDEINLPRLAKEKCEGCRLSWRFGGQKTWRHREPMPTICTAQDIRIQLGRKLAPGNI